MNWNAVGAVGQILGSLATFVTVGFLAVQMHDTEHEMKRAIAQSRTERAMNLNLAQATNERLADITIRANEVLLFGYHRTPPPPIPPELAERLKSMPMPPNYIVGAIKDLGLTPQEAVMLDSLLSARLVHIAQTVMYLGDLPRGERMQFDASNRNWFRQPVTQFWFNYNKSTFNPDTVEYLENLLSEPRGDPTAPVESKVTQSS